MFAKASKEWRGGEVGITVNDFLLGVTKMFRTRQWRRLHRGVNTLDTDVYTLGYGGRRGGSVFITGPIVVQPFLISEMKVDLSTVLGNKKAGASFQTT